VTPLADVYCARIEYPKMAGASHAKSRVVGGCGSEARESSRVAYLVKKLVGGNEGAIRHWKNIMTETSRHALSKQLTRVMAINLMCLATFIAFRALMTLGSRSVLLIYWNEHGAASVIMIAIVFVLSAIELTVSRLGSWQR
jgi:hypothetical protein